MTRKPDSRLRTLERVAGVTAVIAALVVLNGAWVNQHNWQNVSWRVAVASMLVALAIAVETDALGMLQSIGRRGSEPAVPDFLRAGAGPSERVAERSEDATGVAHTRVVGDRESAELIEH